MKKLLLILTVFIFTNVWAMGPKVAEPLENAVIDTDTLMIFVYATPFDVEQKYSLYVEFFHKGQNSSFDRVVLSPTAVYKYDFDISGWSDGNYYLKAVYVDDKLKEMSAPTIHNFSVQKK